MTYQVNCYRNSNRRGRPLTYYVRASSEQRAAECGKRLSGLRYATAFPYHPERDIEMRRFIREVPA